MTDDYLNQHIIMSDQKTNRHPKGLWCLSIAYAAFFFAYVGLISYLVLYLMDVFEFSSDEAYTFFASFNALIWSFPLLGGYLAEKFGYKPVAAIGFILTMLGLLICSIAAKLALYIGLSTFIIGYGLATPACFAMIGLMYDKQDNRRESAYTLFYLLFNIGGLLSISSCGYLISYFGYHATLVIESFSIIVALVLIAWLNRWIQPYQEGEMHSEVKFKTSPRIFIIAGVALLAIPLGVILLKFTNISTDLIWLIFIGSCLAVLWMAYKQKEKSARLKLYALLFLLIISLIIWALYFLVPSLLTVFIENNVNRHVGNFILLPASTYYALDGFFVVVIGYFFSRLWWYLGSKNKGFSIPTKFFISLISIALGYLVLVIGLHFVNASGLLNMGWVIVYYFLIAIGELLVGPISFAMVGRLSPQGKDGRLMGVQQLFMGTGAILSGNLAELAATPTASTPLTTNPVYSHAYLEMVVGTIIAAFIVVFTIQPIKRLMN